MFQYVLIFCLLAGVRGHTMSNKIATYEDVKAATQNKAIYIVDVREPKEIADTGSIPNSLNVPLSTVEQVLITMTPDDFEQKYNRPKPTFSDEIIFSCLSGRRATAAAETATKLGFTNAVIYLGSWNDWKKHLDD